MSTLIILFGIVIVLKVAAETRLRGKERKQRRTFYRKNILSRAIGAESERWS